MHQKITVGLYLYFKHMMKGVLWEQWQTKKQTTLGFSNRKVGGYISGIRTSSSHCFNGCLSCWITFRTSETERGWKFYIFYNRLIYLLLTHYS
jgi:hypothetical protein